MHTQINRLVEGVSRMEAEFRGVVERIQEGVGEDGGGREHSDSSCEVVEVVEKQAESDLVKVQQPAVTESPTVRQLIQYEQLQQANALNKAGPAADSGIKFNSEFFKKYYELSISAFETSPRHCTSWLRSYSKADWTRDNGATWSPSASSSRNSCKRRPSSCLCSGTKGFRRSKTPKRALLKWTRTRNSMNASGLSVSASFSSTSPTSSTSLAR